MTKVNGWAVAGMLTVSAMILSGCSTASIDRGQAKAQTGAPDVAQVDVVSIPYDNAYPKYVVAVEPFTYAASGTVSGGRPGQHAGDFSRASVGPGLSAQLLTALSRSHNLQVVEVSALKKTADGGFGLKLEEGEIGPFILRGTVTEFNETADLSGGKKKVRLGPLGWIMGLVGAITDKDALTYAGAGVAAADVKYEKGNVKRQGMVGFDVRIINGANNRIVGAFNSSGTFVTMSATSGLSVFGIGKSNEEFAASALGQATRAAMNDAVKQTTDLLKAKHGSAATR